MTPDAATVDATEAAPSAAPRGLARGALLGRYVIIDRIGAGGMGVVYAAYDPTLDRKVAVKLLRGGGGDADTRLLREAQAMARLSHPNVIAVHDVGTIDDQVFVAMEFVEGVTLSAWLREHGTSWRAVLAILLQAGRGLAAAHAAGLVHRDFKPDNVLVDRDGRARVGDFGLARAADSEVDLAATQQPLGDSHRSARNALDTPLTHTGAFLGTPAYMAPEQFLGQTTDARTDQFGFCVALFEALYGERPFGGANLAELKQEVVSGHVKHVAKRVPSWLHDATLRGLAAHPDDRFPTMTALLDELSRDRARARRRWLAAGTAVVIPIVVFAGYRGLTREQPTLCRGADQRLVGVWDDHRRGELQAAFAKVGTPQAGDAFERTARGLDDYAHAWVAMRTEACEATHVRGEQSADLLDLRMECLDHRLGELRADVELFAHADAAIVDHAIKASHALSPLADCANTASLRSPTRPPSDPISRARLDELRAKLAAAKAAYDAGKYADALPPARAVVDGAHALGYAPLEAEALVQLAAGQEGSGDADTAVATLANAAAVAITGHADATLASAWIDAIWDVGYDLRRFDEAERLEQEASAVVHRLGNDERLTERLLKYSGVVLEARGKFAEALDHHRRALALEEKLGLETAGSLNNVALALADQGDLEGALGNYQRAVTATEAAVGTVHPDVAIPLNNMGSLLHQMGREDEALPVLQRALDIRERTLGRSHPRVAGALDNLAITFGALGRHDDAIAMLERALAIRQQVYGDAHPLVADALDDLGNAFAAAGRYDDAKARYERALAISEHGPQPADGAVALVGLAELDMRQRRPADAIPVLERAQRLAESGTPLRQAVVRFVLARALWDGGGDRTRAAKLAATAREAFVAEKARAQLAELDRWLVERH